MFFLKKPSLVKIKPLNAEIVLFLIIVLVPHQSEYLANTGISSLGLVLTRGHTIMLNNVDKNTTKLNFYYHHVITDFKKLSYS